MSPKAGTKAIGQFLSVDFKKGTLPDVADRNLNDYLSDLASVEDATYENKPSLIYFGVQATERDIHRIPKYLFQALGKCMALGILYFEGREAGWEEGLLLKFFHVTRIDVTSVSPEDNRHINYNNAPGLLLASSKGEVVEFLAGGRAVEVDALKKALLKALDSSGIDGEELLRRGVRDIPRIQALEDRRYEIEDSMAEVKADVQSQGVTESASNLELKINEYKEVLASIMGKLTKAYDEILEVPLLYSI